MAFPQDFQAPPDQGGPGQSRPVGGFGGNPSKTQAEHRSAVQSAGKAPVILIHGNMGSADLGRWNMLDLRQMLLDSGYPEELIWALSYLGTAANDWDRLDDLGLPISPHPPSPHTNNVNEVREYIDKVCEYTGVEVVDIIAHSLGCSLAYSVFRGLKKQRTPVTFDQPKRWNRVGTFVALAGAFHGLGQSASGEWETGGEFMTKLLAETGGGAGETPYGNNQPQTPPPAHNITYFCGIARGDFVDNQNPGTGRLAGAINRVYDLGPADVGHERIKESRVVFNDFSPLLNSVPPVRPVTIMPDRDSGSYDSPLTITVRIEPSDRTVSYVANKVTKQFREGIIATFSTDTLNGSLDDGQALMIPTNGMWEVVFSAEGAADVKRTYWVDTEEIEVTIITDNSIPFEETLDVLATTTRGTLYHSLRGGMWSEGPVVTITSDAAPQFIALDSDGVASEIVSKPFKKAVTRNSVTATAVEHYVAKRISVGEYLAYGQQFGFTTPFTLYLVNGRWVLNPSG